MEIALFLAKRREKALAILICNVRKRTEKVSATSFSVKGERKREGAFLLFIEKRRD